MNINESFYCSRCLRELEDEGVCPFCGYDEDAQERDGQALVEGAMLGNRRYRIGALIGRGGFGMTYAAWDRTLLAPVAIKEYFPAGYARRDGQETDEVAVSEEDRVVFAVGLNNFNREAHILAALSNVEHVVKVYNCFEENNTGYIVMEYVRGVTLTQYVREHEMKSDALLSMLRAPIDALVMIHAQGVMHRDITPENLMVQEDGTIKLIDFGAAHVEERLLKGKDYSISATQHYAAPEQYDARMAQGQWTDVYGLSATIYALLTGCQPPDSQERMRRDTLVPPGRMGKKLTRRQERALIEGLRIDPQSRLRSVEEFRAILYNLPTPEAVRQRKRMFLQMAAAMGAMTAAAILLIVNFSVGFPLGGGLRYGLRGNGWHVSGGVGTRENIVIPERKLFLPVREISDRAFEDGEAIRTVTVPGSVVRVGAQAFYGCTALTSAQLEAGVREIGDLAFALCESLVSVTMPGTLAVVGERAFLDTPPYMTCWGEENERLHELAKAHGAAYAVRSEYEIEETEGGAVLTGYCGRAGEVVLPSVIDGLRVVQMDGDALFWAFPEKTTSVVFPYFLEEIPDGEMFYQPGALKRVQLGPHVKRIGEAAFSDCGITEIALPEGLEEIGEKAFYFSDLTQVEIPRSVRVIGKDAFDFTALERAVIPETVESIGSSAFGSNDELKQVDFPRTLEIKVLGDIFYGCSALESITIPDSVKVIDILAFSGCTSLEAVNLPEGVETIDYGAFSDCIGLKYIGIPESVTEIHMHAFDGCSAQLVIGGFPGSEAQRYAEAYGYAFEDRSLWTPGMIADGEINARQMQGDLVCPAFDEESNALIKTVRNIYADGVSEDAAPLTSIRLPRFAEEIALGAINEMEALETLELPGSLEAIRTLALKDNVRLEKIVLPEGLRMIEGSAFSGCTSLTGAQLPQSLELLGSAAFFGCTALKEIGIPPKLTDLTFRIFSESGLSSVRIPSNIRVCHNAFSDCRQLKTAEAEEGLLEMYGTFEGCTALETVRLPASLEYMSGEVFRGCTALNDVYFEGMEMRCWFYADGEGRLFSPEAYFRALEGGAKEITHVFADSPQVTIHARRGSTMEMYAQVFDLNLETIEEPEE